MRLARIAMPCGLCIWGALVLAGFGLVWHYATAPGESGTPLARWPADTVLATERQHVLALFAHPHCPCTRASLAELEKLMARCQSGVTAHVVFIAPEASDWEDSELVERARRIPGVQVHYDLGRQETARFGARTSGTCLLYDPDGKLVFAGGLTSGRGHEGENAGSEAIRAHLAGTAAERLKTAESLKTAVYGCALFEPSCPITPQKLPTP